MYIGIITLKLCLFSYIKIKLIYKQTLTAQLNNDMYYRIVASFGHENTSIYIIDVLIKINIKENKSFN